MQREGPPAVRRLLLLLTQPPRRLAWGTPAQRGPRMRRSLDRQLLVRHSSLQTQRLLSHTCTRRTGEGRPLRRTVKTKGKRAKEKENETPHLNTSGFACPHASFLLYA
jgi:hypothetical protein